jgi:hypothetical protein
MRHLVTSRRRSAVTILALAALLAGVVLARRMKPALSRCRARALWSRWCTAADIGLTQDRQGRLVQLDRRKEVA